MDKLAIIVLGNRNSGKSFTWNALFKKTVRSGNKSLGIAQDAYVDVFLISGSPQERGKTIDEILESKKPQVILCSIQYCLNAIESFDFLIQNNYKIYCIWLNPGHKDEDNLRYDELGLMNFLLSNNSTVAISSGKKSTEERVRQIEDFLFGWANSRKLIYKW